MSRKHCLTASMLLLLLALLAGLPGFARADGAVLLSPGDPPPLPGKSTSHVYDAWHHPLKIESQAPLVTPLVDHFGYSLDDSGTIDWIDATTGSEVSFQNEDDGYSQEIPIGFSFAFYEQVFASLWINTNGMVTFGGGSDSFSNGYLPHDTPPNNLLAAFWDDLELGGGGVYTLRTMCGASNADCFVIEWNQVLRVGSSDEITFEIILFENGDIWFQYLALIGNLVEATVGIEDGDGADGLLYLCNAPGLSPGLVLDFTRPPAGPRLKLLPRSQSGFVFNDGASFHFQVRNTNTSASGEDTFDISLAASQPGWELSLYTADRQTLLTDSDRDGLPDTGPLSPGSTATIILKVKAPESSQAGDYQLVNLIANSSDQPSRIAEGEIGIAVPANFVQAYSDSRTGVLLDLISREEDYVSPVSPSVPGDSLSVAGGGQGYLLAWEENLAKTVGNQTAFYSDIFITLLDRFGVVSRGPDNLTDHGPETDLDLSVYARHPAVAVAPDGNIGLLWVEYRLELPNFLTNSNIYFAILNRSGKLIFGPRNLTKNAGWRGPGAEEVPVFSYPRLVATDDNRFFLAWMDGHFTEGGEQSGIHYGIYTSRGAVIRPATLFAESTPGVTFFVDPTLAGLAENRVLQAYSIYSETQKSYTVAFTILNSNGDTIRSLENIPGSSGWRADAVQLSTGNLLLAWTDPAAEKISYTILSGSDYQVVDGPKHLAAIGMRKPDFVSVSTDKSGKGVLTWMDADWNDYLYYALVGSQGQLFTPAMIFAAGEAENPHIQTSSSGQGVDSYGGARRSYFPVIKR